MPITPLPKEPTYPRDRQFAFWLIVAIIVVSIGGFAVYSIKKNLDAKHGYTKSPVTSQTK